MHNYNGGEVFVLTLKKINDEFLHILIAGNPVLLPAVHVQQGVKQSVA